MKTKLKFRQLFQNLLIITIMVISSVDLLAQEKKITDLKDFKLVVENTDNGLKLKSLVGCAWDDLIFDIKNCKPQAINEYGMIEIGENSSDQDANLANFLIEITSTENGIILKGIEGTVWTELRFSLDKKDKQAFNQFGMVELN